MNNVYNSVLVSPATPTVVNSIVVPERSGYSLKGLIIWCEADLDIEIKLNVETIGGGRVSGSVQTLFLDFSSSPFGIGAFDVVSVIATQADSLTPVADYLVKSTLLVEQL